MTARLLSPSARFELAHFGELLSDPSRVAMLLALMDGSARPASELAALAGVTQATASVHLRKLVEGGLLRVEPAGRHRYFGLASARAAESIEALFPLVADRPARKPAPSAARMALTAARTCYRHLAGRLGVAWFQALERRRCFALTGGAIALSSQGRRFFAAQGLAAERWPAGKPCLDWTERKPHLGGPLGTLLTDHLFARRWLSRAGDGRAVRVTASGRRELLLRLGLRVEP